MTRDGAVEINKSTGGAERISAREPDISPASDIIGGVVDRVQTERRAAKKKTVRKENRKIFESVQRKPETTRLKFTDAERANPALAKSIKKSDRAADRYEKARARIPKEKVLTVERISVKATNAPPPVKQRERKKAAKTQSVKRGKQPETVPKDKMPPSKPVIKESHVTKTRLVFRERDKPPNGKLTHIFERPGREAVNAVRSEAKKYENDNTGVQAAGATERTAERAVRKIGDVHSRLKFEPQRQLFKAEEKAVNANVNAIYKRDLQIKPELEKASASQKAAYKKHLKKDYTRAFRQGNFENLKKKAEKAKKTAKKAGDTVQETAKFTVKHWKVILIIGCALLLLMVLLSGISACAGMFSGGGIGVIGTSYTAEDADILGADADYTALETALSAQINNIPSDYPGYDEYNYSVGAIGHNSYELTGFLAALDNVTDMEAVLVGLFNEQYALNIEEIIATRERPVTEPAEDGGEEETEEYEYRILNITLTVKPFLEAITSRLTPAQLDRFNQYDYNP